MTVTLWLNSRANQNRGGWTLTKCDGDFVTTFTVPMPYITRDQAVAELTERKLLP